MAEWKRSLGGSWENYQDQLTPSVWLFMCRRPADYKKAAGLPWGWVYLFDGPVTHYKNHVEPAVRFEYEAPLEMRCVEMEIRKKYTFAP